MKISMGLICQLVHPPVSPPLNAAPLRPRASALALSRPPDRSLFSAQDHHSGTRVAGGR